MEPTSTAGIRLSRAMVGRGLHLRSLPRLIPQWSAADVGETGLNVLQSQFVRGIRNFFRKSYVLSAKFGIYSGGWLAAKGLASEDISM